MPFPEQEKVFIKSEGDFYASFSKYPLEIITHTQGTSVEEEGRLKVLRISEEILNPNSLFYRYLGMEKSRKIFGTKNPLFESSTVTYEGQNPIKINHFNTRLLIAFLEVQLGISFSEETRQEYENKVRETIAGNTSSFIFENKYYYPFTHEVGLGVGIHYIQDSKEKGGYYEEDWYNFINYSVDAIKKAYQISPEEFASSPHELENKINTFAGQISREYLNNGLIYLRPIRQSSHSMYEILHFKGSEEAKFIRNPKTGEKMQFISIMDCLIDMPYKNGAKVTFQSGCDDSF